MIINLFFIFIFVLIIEENMRKSRDVKERLKDDRRDEKVHNEN